MSLSVSTISTVFGTQLRSSSMHIDLMFDSLDGLSVGDALGAVFPILRRTIEDVRTGRLSGGPWNWTDDTEMACSVVAELCDNGGIGQDRLAAAFAKRCDRGRDYGFMTVDSLRRIRDGAHWRDVAAAAFDHQGSCGNGAAMRVAPLGACYAGDPERIVTEAIRSAEVTHLHPEGVAGAVAVAVAAGRAATARMSGVHPAPAEFIDDILPYLDDGETTRRIRHARTLLGAPIEVAANELGNGSRVTAQDTVPLAIWAAATHLGNYPAAIATCLAADGDIDTTGAITGGIVAAYTGAGTGPVTGVPKSWLSAREPLPAWLDLDRRARPKSRRLRRWWSGGS